jgi:hypothetical protein
MSLRIILRILSATGLIFALGFQLSSASADETTIVLDQQTPYVDVPVEATEPTTLTVQTTTGTPQTNPGFIDSWIELWQGTTKLFANDDGAHSATNVLASIITAPIDSGIYFIRATSFAWMASNYTQAPNGTYLLSWSGVTTLPTPTPTPTVEPSPTIEPSPTPTETVTPTPTPEPTPTETSSPTPTPTIEPTPTETPTQQPDPVEDNEPNVAPVVPSISPEPEILEEVIQEEELIEQLLPEETIETPIEEIQTVEENVTPEEENVGLLDSTEIVLAVFADAIGQSLDFAGEVAGEVFAIADQSVTDFLNIGDDMSDEVREEAQTIVVSTIIVTQLATAVSLATQTSTTSSASSGGTGGSSSKKTGVNKK